MHDEEIKITYVKKVEDEMTKNHHENDQQEIITGFIPQLLQSDGTPHKLCPMRSFENYLSNLNQGTEKLWQHPWMSSYNKGLIPWYSKSSVGKNPHSTFMQDLSQEVGLSRIYTNHSIRVTGTTNLTRA